MRMSNDSAMALFDEMANLRGAFNCIEAIKESSEDGSSITITIENECGLSGEIVMDQSHESYERVRELMISIIYETKRTIKNGFEIDID